MNKRVSKCTCPFLQQWGIGVASLALSLGAAPELKAQGLWIHGTYSPRTANTPATNNPVPPSAPAPAPTPAPATQPAATEPAPATTPPANPPPAGSLENVPPPTLQASPPKPKKNEVAASGDFLYGDGQVTLPLGYSLHASGAPGVSETAFSLPRASTYYGGTLSYSYGQAWYVDFSYAHGSTSGSQVINTGFLGPLPSSFSIDDSWYQVYLEYAFPQLRGKRFSAYLRAGFTYVTADLSDTAVGNEAGRYSQKDSTDDILGNLGVGVGYTLYTTRRLRLGLQVEGEGFYGSRSQSSLENFNQDTGLSTSTANIDNNLYGGIGRGTLRAEYRLGRTGLFKIFGEAGVEVRYTEIDYPSAGTFNEYLWGPYVKLGLRYAF